MLYTIFIYKEGSGIMLYKKSFESKIGAKSELFSSFFSAIQNFVKEMVTSDSKNNSLEGLSLANYIVHITKVPDLEVEVVAIADKQDQKEIKKFTVKFLKILKGHQELFKGKFNGSINRYEVIDLELIRLLSKYKKLSGQIAADAKKSQLMEKVLDSLPELEKEQRNKNLEEIKFLDSKLKKEANLIRKLEIIESIQQVCQKLKDPDKMEQILRQKRKIKQKLSNLKQKLGYYIYQVKTAISSAVDSAPRKKLVEIDFKDAYINLYSFSSKLKFIGREDLSKKYKELALQIIEKPPEIRDKFPEVIQEILSLSDDVSTYIS